MPLRFDRRVVLAGAIASGVSIGARGEPATGRLVRRGDRLFVTARVNGVATEAVLDSAAETSLLSPAFAARIGLAGGETATTHGSGADTMKAQLVEHVRLEAAGVRVPDATVAIIDLSDVGRRLIGRPIDMVLGREIFDAARLLIDIRGGVVRPLAKGETPTGRALPLTDSFGIEAVPVVIEDYPPTQAAFDLGNGTGVIIAKHYADSIRLLDGRPTQALAGGGLGGARPRTRVTLKSLTLAGHRFTNVPADIDDAPNSSDVNVGVGLLQHFRITADFAAHRVWLAEN